jgi:Xaa-Pro aminopeptidase
MHAFETLTQCPYDRSLMELGLLTAEERGWIDAYHAQLPGILSPLLDDAERAWLDGACRPL